MSEQRTWIKNPLAVFTANSLDARGGIVTEGQKIAELLTAGQPPSQPVDHIYDASESVLLPGLINTHHHFYQTLTRAWAPVVNVPLFPWLKKLYPVWAQPAPVSAIVRCRICGWLPVCARRGIWRPLAYRLVWALTVRRRMMHQT